MSNSEPVALLPRILLGGKELSAGPRAKVIELRVEIALNLPGRCSIRFADTSWSPHLAEAGTTIEVRAPNSRQVVFKGAVVAIELDCGSEAHPVTTLVAYDFSHLLAGRSGAETYVNASPVEILTRIARRHGLKVNADADSLRGTYEYLAQAGSDLEMVDAIAARHGADWWYADDQLNVRQLDPTGPGAQEVRLAELERFSVRASVDRPDEMVVMGWNPSDQESLTGTSRYASSMLSTDAPFVDRLVSGAAGAPDGETPAKRPAQVSNVPVANKTEAHALAASFMRTSAQQSAHVEGVGRGLWRLGPGQSLRLTGAERFELAGTYLLTSVEHRYDPVNGASTRFTCGARRSVGLMDLLDGDGRSPMQHGGLLVGQVTNTKDPLKQGRVKVTFVGLDPKNESNWARVLASGAGKNRGAVVLPEVGDEVLVGFEGGDLRKPIVLGGMFGNKSKIPLWGVDQADGSIQYTRTTSRTGHYLEFADGKNDADRHVEIGLSDDKTKLHLGVQGGSSLEVPAGQKLTIKVGNSSIAFDDQGNIAIKGAKISIEAKTELLLKGVQVKVDGTKTAVEGKTLDLKGTKGTLDGGGLLEIKAGVVKIN